MDVYKEFIQRIRRLELGEVYILLSEDLTEKLNNYILLLKDAKFEDGSYHTYYGDVKRIVASFLVYFGDSVEEVIKAADKYNNGKITREEIMCLVVRTISIQQSKQVVFGNGFLPVLTEVEKKVYDKINGEYNEYMLKLDALKEKVGRLDKKEKVDDFVKENLGRAVHKTSELFNMAHDYIGMMLADSLDRIRTSVEEIHLRMSNNLRRVQQECEDGVSALLHLLYDKNKEGLRVSRCDRKCSKEYAEVNRGIQHIKSKIANYEPEILITRLQDEVAYWIKRLADFNEIADNLVKLKADQDNTIKEETVYNSLKNNELPGRKYQCWLNMGQNFAERKEYLKRKILDEGKTLITFFAVRGTDRIFYTNDIGPHYVDEYNHQVYVFDHGLAVYHVNCEGDYKQFPDHPYFFDKCGRYINLDGVKIYQVAPCTSQYKLGDDQLLEKVSKDCGHSERNNTQCRMQIQDPNYREMLPDFKPIDIKSTLDTETVRYLWDSFGSLLPEALYDVGIARPRNPIHYLAHKLLYHKYHRTASELKQKKKEAEDYRANIYKERKERAKEATVQWRSKQVKRRKPEESDDALDRAVYDAQIAQQMFIQALNFE